MSGAALWKFTIFCDVAPCSLQIFTCALEEPALKLGAVAKSLPAHT
jgi:hypothetical protein